MSRVFTDGFAHYSDILRKWASYYAPANVPTPGTSAQRRTGTSSMTGGATSSAWNYLTSNVLAGLTDRAFVGAAALVPVGASSSVAITLMSGSTEQVTAKWDGATGKLSVLRGGVNGTQLAITSAAVGEFGIWNYLEFGSVIHDTAGTTEVRFNGAVVSELTLTSQDTKPGAAAGVDAIRLQWNSPATVAWTDVLVDDTAFQGDIVIDTIFPSGVGTHADFTPNPAGDNYANVDETRADGDGTYNASSDQGDMDTFAMGNLTAMPTSEILCVSVNLDLRKDDAATRQVKAVIRQGTTDYLHATAMAPAGTFKIHQRLFDTSPDDSLAWEEADVNNAEVGYEQSLVS